MDGKLFFKQLLRIIKRQICPTERHGGIGNWRYNLHSFLTYGRDGSGGQLHALVALLRWKAPPANPEKEAGLVSFLSVLFNCALNCYDLQRR